VGLGPPCCRLFIYFSCLLFPKKSARLKRESCAASRKRGAGKGAQLKYFALHKLKSKVLSAWRIAVLPSPFTSPAPGSPFWFHRVSRTLTEILAFAVFTFRGKGFLGFRGRDAWECGRCGSHQLNSDTWSLRK